MRAAYTPAERERLIAWACERMAVGLSFWQVAQEPGAPDYHTFMRWQRRDPVVKMRFAEARRWGKGVRFENRHPLRWRFDGALALTLLERVRAGERTSDLVHAPGFPDWAALNGWRRINPDFARELKAAQRVGKALRRRLRPRWSWDPAVADRILVRVVRGEPLRSVSRDPELPGMTDIVRWRRARPEFDAELRAAMRIGHRRACAARGLAARERPTPELVEEVGARIFAGASIAEVCAQPDMPDVQMLRRWRREDRQVAADIERACDMRDWMLEDQAYEIAAAATRATVKDAGRRIGAIRKRIAAMRATRLRPPPEG